MRPDLDVVAAMIPRGARVLDLGCGDGALLDHLMREHDCTGLGVELAPEPFHAAMARGIPVIQADIDAGLPDFEEASYDVVVLSQTLQATRRPSAVLAEVVRVGRRGILSFPNFGHWRVRLDLLTHGRMPVSRALPHTWHDTPNIHLCTVRDFERLAADEGVRLVRRVLLDDGGQAANGSVARRPNLLAAGAVYLVER